MCALWLSLFTSSLQSSSSKGGNIEPARWSPDRTNPSRVSTPDRIVLELSAALLPQGWGRNPSVRVAGGVSARPVTTSPWAQLIIINMVHLYAWSVLGYYYACGHWYWHAGLPSFLPASAYLGDTGGATDQHDLVHLLLRHVLHDAYQAASHQSTAQPVCLDRGGVLWWLLPRP